MFKFRLLWLVVILPFVFSMAACEPERLLDPIFTHTPTITATFTLTPAFTASATSTETATLTLTPQPVLEQAGTATVTLTPSDTHTPTPAGGGGGVIAYVNVDKQEDGLEIYNLFSVNVDGTGIKDLTNNNDPNVIFMRPRWSPDGQLLLYQKIVSYGESLGSTLHSMMFDGSDIHLVSPPVEQTSGAGVDEILYDAFGEFSPDGKTIAFASNRHVLSTKDPTDFEIYLLSLETGELKMITDSSGVNVHPSWSPDGSNLVFMSDRDGDWEIFSMDARGNNLNKLTNNDADDRFPRWSPDGGSIIYHSDRDGNFDIYVLALDGLQDTKVTHDSASDAAGSWSPDGKWILFHSQRDGDSEIYILNVEDGQLIQLTNNESTDVVPSWRP